jgi:hypothetical protein
MLCSLRRVLVASTLLLLAGSASAQDTTFNDVWFKLKIKIKGEAVAGSEKPHKASLSVTAFLHFSVQEMAADSTTDGAALASTSYDYELWTEAEPGVWSVSVGDSDSLETADPTDFYLPDMFLTVNGKDQASVGAYLTCGIKAKLDGEGALKSATIKSFGGEVFEGTTDGADDFRGGMALSGKTVAVDDLPFTPDA